MQKIFENAAAVISYKDEGTGMSLVMVHGLCEDGNIWNTQLDFLKHDFRIIVPDLPGSGKSVYTNEQLSLQATLEYYADRVYELLKFEEVETCILFGHSMGGCISLAFAEKYPDMLKGLGLIHATAFADSEEKKQKRLQNVSLIEKEGSSAFAEKSLPGLFGEKFKKENRQKVDELVENGNNFSKQALQNYTLAMMNRKDRKNVLESSAVPVLFVIGSEDNAVPMNDLLQQVSLPKIAYIHILDEVGHMGMLEASEKVNKAMLGFIRSII